MDTSANHSAATMSSPPNSSTDPTATATSVATDGTQPSPLPSATFSLSGSAKHLYSDAQRERDETTDDGISPYLLQRRKFYEPAQWATLLGQLAATATLYAGNLAFYTTEEQLYSFFALAGRVRLVRMGLNERTMTPCGFCFVEYDRHDHALECQRQLSGLMCDERVIRADLDPGFEEGRQFGRSKLTGGQIRDDHRKDFDPGRGGYVVHQQQTTFAPLVPGIIRIVPTASRKKQRIDLRAVRANRGERRPRNAAQPQPRQQQASTGSGGGGGGRDRADKVGQKRRRDHDDDEDERAEEEADELEDDGLGGGGGDGGAGGAEDGDGDVAVDDAEELPTSGEEVATSGAEGDIESAAELDGDATSVET